MPAQTRFQKNTGSTPIVPATPVAPIEKTEPKPKPKPKAKTPVVPATPVAPIKKKEPKPKPKPKAKPTKKAANVGAPAQIEKLKRIADVENRNAAAYADDSTPGGCSEIILKKNQQKTKATQSTGVEQEVATDSELGTDGDETEGSPKKQRTKKGRNLRNTIQAMRQDKLNLCQVEEVSEGEEGVGEAEAVAGTAPKHVEDTVGKWPFFEWY